MNSSNVSDGPQTIRLRSSRLSADELLLHIPIELIIGIFSKLPLKSIARCRCVSKQWASVLGRSDFTELFLTKSLARPRLLFARQDDSQVIFFSLPQPQKPDENFPTVATVDHHMSVPFKRVRDISSCVNGYVSYYRMAKGMKTEEFVYVICNPSTRQCFTLPKTRKRTETRNFLGYDPVEKQHKVLAVTCQDDGAVEHQVLTLRENRNLTWRMTECGIHHSFPWSYCICINGVLYYIAKASSGDYIIVCFDVRFEKYSSVKSVKSAVRPATLFNYNGKLASLMAQPDPFRISETSTILEMWILEDPEKHEWSKRIFNLPPIWTDAALLRFVGVTATNEFVLSPLFPSGPFHVYYYNFVKESIRRVEIQGIGGFITGSIVLTFLNHVEDVKLM
ncbi:hypothetical protein Bca4012_029879 [Brassica carinata]